MSGSDDLLRDQIAYYRAAASRYDDWWDRTGFYDQGPEFKAEWDAEIARVREALEALGPLGRVLEIAGGTGNWTREFVRLATSVSVVDSSPETVAVARAKIDGADVPVEWTITDVFGWEPDQRFDTVFFSFWLSHVPLDRFDAFWELVGLALAPGGRVFFVDNAHPSHSRGRANERRRWVGSKVEGTSVDGKPSVTDLGTGVSLRELRDRPYSLVKIFWEPESLTDRLADLGWSFEITTTDWAFVYGYASDVRS